MIYIQSFAMIGRCKMKRKVSYVAEEHFFS